MKGKARLLVALGLFMGIGQAAEGAVGYGPAGCGLGSIVVGKEPGMGQVFAATTNGTSYSQVFGITSGTSNCIPEHKAAAFKSQKMFIENNIASVAIEAAQGDGETLRALAATLGCNAEGYHAVARNMQAMHGQIFREPGAERVLFSMHEVLRQDEVATQACRNLI